jgi:tetratricopeptide (TPR) repeat protein
VHWGHQVRDRFPGGSLYVNLRGHDPGTPAPPEQVLDGFLRTLGVPAEKIAPDLEQRAAQYRSLLDGRRVLVVLDNAASAEQVRPLLPGAAGSMAVVTSRNTLSSLAARDGAYSIGLDRLSEADAIALLGQIIGADEVDAAPAAAADLARRCAYLPLALRIAAQRAAGRPRHALTEVIADLVQRQLDALDTDDDHTAVRTVFSWSYRALPDEAARAFRLLGLHPGPDTGVHAAAALIDSSPAETRRLLDALTGAHLLEQTGRDRYRLHDLLRLYAAELAEQEETAQHRAQVIRRVLRWYLDTAVAAAGILFPDTAVPLVDDTWTIHPPLDFTTHQQALTWYDTEYHNLVAAPGRAAEAGHHDIAWRLPVALWIFFFLRKHWTDWFATHRVALASARQIGDGVGEGRVLSTLGEVHRLLARFPDSIDHQERALAIAREFGDRAGQEGALIGLGTVYLDLRRFDKSIDYLRRALAIARELGNETMQGWSLNGLGYAHLHLDRYAESAEYFQKAVIAVHGVNSLIEAWALHGLSCVYRYLRRLKDSLDYGMQALALNRRMDDLWCQGEVLYNLGKTQHALGQHVAAHRSWEKAMFVFQDQRTPRAAQVLARLKAIRNGDTT